MPAKGLAQEGETRKMRKAENVNAPNLTGWVIGAAAGLVAFGVLVVVGKFDLFPAAAMAGGLAAVVGLILGLPSRVAAPQPAMSGMKATADAAPEAVAPKAKAASTPAAFVAAPVSAPVAAPVAAPAAKAKVTPAKAAKAAGPERLKGARKGKADDLKVIEGIGPAMEKLVNSLGFFHFDQIASWSDSDVALVDAEMKTFKGRIARDKWVAQAKIIVTEGLEAFHERAKTNNY